jgi:serine-type D-Ala-D-Ala carboxypeptidase/endopeptidase
MQVIGNILILAFLLWMFANGSFDPLLAKLSRRLRSNRQHAAPGTDPAQATANAHVAVTAPNSALAIAIVTPGGTRHVFAGNIDGKGSSPPNADTSFEIGSISKTFTAAMLVAMERQGLVKLDTPLDELLPAENRLGKQTPSPVTLEQLATHHSGLPRLPWGLPMFAGMYFTPRQPYRFIGESTLMRWLRRREVQTGRRYLYSNLGYGVLGEVLARRAGRGYPEALRRFVLDPLGLDATHAEPTSPCAQPHSALGRRVPGWNMRALAAAGGLRSTLADMTRWLQANMQDQAPLDARLYTARARSGNPCRNVALAWQVDGTGEQRAIWHNGRTGGSSSFAGFVPARGIGVVVLSNAAVSVDRLGLQFLSAAANAPDAAPAVTQIIPETRTNA